MRWRAAAAATAVLMTGCGGGADDPAPPDRGATPPSSSTEDDRLREALRIPPRVPLRGEGEAPEADAEVVRRWMAELSRGQVERAAARFALPARFANLGPAAVLRSRREALAVTAALPCGALVTKTRAAAGYVVYEAQLTDRPGGSCGQGVGGKVAGAILVRDGKIAEWWRLPDRRRPSGSEIV